LHFLAREMITPKALLPSAHHDWESFLLVVVYSLQRKVLQQHFKLEPRSLQMFCTIFGATGTSDVSRARENVLRKNPGIDKYLETDSERRFLLRCRILIHEQTEGVLVGDEKLIQYEEVKKLFDGF
jgi:hypothetical protein